MHYRSEVMLGGGGLHYCGTFHYNIKHWRGLLLWYKNKTVRQPVVGQSQCLIMNRAGSHGSDLIFM